MATPNDTFIILKNNLQRIFNDRNYEVRQKQAGTENAQIISDESPILENFTKEVKDSLSELILDNEYLDLKSRDIVVLLSLEAKSIATNSRFLDSLFSRESLDTWKDKHVLLIQSRPLYDITATTNNPLLLFYNSQHEIFYINDLLHNIVDHNLVPKHILIPREIQHIRIDNSEEKKMSSSYNPTYVKRLNAFKNKEKNEKYVDLNTLPSDARRKEIEILANIASLLPKITYDDPINRYYDGKVGDLYVIIRKVTKNIPASCSYRIVGQPGRLGGKAK